MCPGGFGVGRDRENVPDTDEFGARSTTESVNEKCRLSVMREPPRSAGIVPATELPLSTDDRRRLTSDAIDPPAPEHALMREAGPMLEMARRILDHAAYGGSIFVPGDVWTEENLLVLKENFVEREDVSARDFAEKLPIQLATAPDEAILLFAEIYSLQMLPLAKIGPERKRENIEGVLALLATPVPMLDDLIEAFRFNAFGGGTAATTRRYQQLCVLIEFFLQFRLLDEKDRQDAVRDPLAWRRLVADSPGTAEPSVRRSLMFLRHPWYFLPIVSEDHMTTILTAFFPEVTGRERTDDPDRDMAALRYWMEPEGAIPEFYVEPLKSLWNPRDGEDLVPVRPSGSSAEEEPDEDASAYGIDDIMADGAFHDPMFLRRIIKRWEETRNIVLQGPPGTGKTWLAKRLAYALIGSRDDAAVRCVQFHPGTSYEDLVRGWRPGGDGTLTLVDGPLLQHAELARTHPDIPHVLLVEEFNRGNPAQAFGEMLTLLEATKRTANDALELSYMKDGENPFWLPPNFHLIGTMNTADRSLALVDFALRRRFAFVDLAPAFTPAWEKLVQDQFPRVPATVISAARDRIERLNAVIADDPSLGDSFRVGHSYFTPGQESTDFTEWFRGVVDTSVRPQLVEYWHGNPHRVEEAVAALRGEA